MYTAHICSVSSSYKFGRKVAYINRLDELKPVLFLDQIDIPEEVRK